MPSSPVAPRIGPHSSAPRRAWAMHRIRRWPLSSVSNKALASAAPHPLEEQGSADPPRLHATWCGAPHHVALSHRPYLCLSLFRCPLAELPPVSALVLGRRTVTSCRLGSPSHNPLAGSRILTSDQGLCHLRATKRCGDASRSRRRAGRPSLTPCCPAPPSSSSSLPYRPPLRFFASRRRRVAAPLPSHAIDPRARQAVATDETPSSSTMTRLGQDSRRGTVVALLSTPPPPPPPPPPPLLGPTGQPHRPTAGPSPRTDRQALGSVTAITAPSPPDLPG